MISEEQELGPAQHVDTAEAQEFPTADPDPWEGGNIENGGPEPSKQDADEAGESEARDHNAGESEASESEAGDPGDEGAQAEDAGAEDPQPGETGEEGQDAGNAGEEAETEELKVVLHVRNGRANAGVWRPGADAHLEVFLETGVDVLLSELPGLIERANARWEANPMRPQYNPPKPKSQSKKGNKKAPKQSSGQSSGQPPSENQPENQTGNGQEQTGMARLF